MPVSEQEEFDGEEEGGEEESTEPSQYLTAAQVQAMMDRQAEMFTQGLQQTVERYVPQRGQQQEPEEEPIRAPSHEDMRQAAEEGDWGRYMDLQAQRENAIYQASVRETNKQVRAFRQEGSQWVAETNKNLIDTKVPDYKKYAKDVEALADTLGIDAVARTDPRVVEMLTSTVRGRPENLEKEVEARIEARKRQANGDGATSDVASLGRGGAARHQEPEPVFSSQSMQVFDLTGKNKDEVARRMGYDDWNSYENRATAIYSDERTIPKWRRPKGVK